MKREEKQTEDNKNKMMEESQINIGKKLKDIINFTIKEEISNQMKNLNLRDNMNKILEESILNEYNRNLQEKN